MLAQAISARSGWDFPQDMGGKGGMPSYRGITIAKSPQTLRRGRDPRYG